MEALSYIRMVFAETPQNYLTRCPSGAMVTGMDANESRAVAEDPAAGLRRQLRFSTAMFFASTLYPSARPWLATAISIRFMIDVLLETQNDDYDPED